MATYYQNISGELVPAPSGAGADYIMLNLNGEYRPMLEAQRASEKRLRDAEDAAAQAREDAEHYKGLNKTLLKISRERSNADRDLRPRAKHSGYVVKISKSKDYRVGQKDEIKLFETTLQTPYLMRFSMAQVQRQAWEDLQRRGEDDSESLLERLGLTFPYDRSYKELIGSGEWRGLFKAKEGRFNVTRETEDDLNGLISALANQENSAYIAELRDDEQKVLELVRLQAERHTALELVDQIKLCGGRASLPYSDLNVYFTTWYTNLIADNRTGYWEIIITHTMPIGDIPAEMDYEDKVQ